MLRLNVPASIGAGLGNAQRRWRDGLSLNIVRTWPSGERAGHVAFTWGLEILQYLPSGVGSWFPACILQDYCSTEVEKPRRGLRQR